MQLSPSTSITRLGAFVAQQQSDKRRSSRYYRSNYPS